MRKPRPFCKCGCQRRTSGGDWIRGHNIRGPARDSGGEVTDTRSPAAWPEDVHEYIAWTLLDGTPELSEEAHAHYADEVAEMDAERERASEELVRQRDEAHRVFLDSVPVP
jgi:hypothetical protein